MSDPPWACLLFCQIADALNLNPIKVRKLLITAGVYESEVAEKVQDTFEEYRKTQNYKDAILVQRGNSGRRRFCSPDCREEYYRQHKPFRIAVCKNCGREFHAVDEGKRQRKFCSLNCYWDYRYGMKGVDEGE